MWSILPSIVLGCKGQGLTNLFYLILQEIPGKEEYKAVTKILKTQTELLQVGDQEKLLPLTFIVNARTATNSNNFVCYSIFCSKILIQEETPPDFFWLFYVPYGNILCLTLKGAQHWHQTSQGD